VDSFRKMEVTVYIELKVYRVYGRSGRLKSRKLSAENPRHQWKLK
jgi:hypothetical protein